MKVDRYKLHKAYYSDEEIKLSGKEIATFLCEIHEAIDEINERLKKLESKKE